MRTKVRVIAPQGAVVRGPAVLQLSAPQHNLRSHLFGPWKKGGKAVLDGGHEVSFKLGETFVIEEDEGRLNTGLFEDLTPAKAEGKHGNDGADTLTGGEDTTAGGGDAT